MAKTGQIQLDGIAIGDEPLADGVVFTESTPSNLGSVVSDLLDKSDDPLKVLVDPVGRTVKAAPVAVDLHGNFNEAGILITTITRDDATKRSSPVSLDKPDLTGQAIPLAFQNALDDIFSAAAKPSKNVSSIVNGVEDALAALAKLDVPVTVPGVRILVDQTGDGSVKIYQGITGLSTEVGITAKLKQVVSDASSGPAPLAFE